MSEKATATDTLAKWSVPILLAVLGFIGTVALGKIDTLGDKVSGIAQIQASQQATLASTQDILKDFKSDAEESRQDTKEKLSAAASETTKQIESASSQTANQINLLTAWITRLSNQIHDGKD